MTIWILASGALLTGALLLALHARLAPEPVRVRVTPKNP